MNHKIHAVFDGAQNKTRTCTSLRTLVPETSASTNFAIWAVDLDCECKYSNNISPAMDPAKFP